LFSTDSEELQFKQAFKTKNGIPEYPYAYWQTAGKHIIEYLAGNAGTGNCGNNVNV